jgi:hypothetical protein
LTLIDVTGAGQLRATWVNVDIALPVEDKASSLKVPLGRADLSHTGTGGVILRSSSHLNSLTAP